MKTSRRTFVKAGAMAAVGTAILPGSMFGSAKPHRIVGLQLYSVRTDMLKDPVGTMTQLARMGYVYVEHANYVDRKFYTYKAPEFRKLLEKIIPDVIIDSEIDPRYPYEFILLFVKLVSEVENYAPLALHNLVSDGILWFAYPKKTSKKHCSDIDRDHGWEFLINAGFYPVRQVAIDDDWSALRFRNARFIKSDLSRFIK